MINVREMVSSDLPKNVGWKDEFIIDESKLNEDSVVIIHQIYRDIIGVSIGTIRGDIVYTNSTDLPETLDIKKNTIRNFDGIKCTMATVGIRKTHESTNWITY